MFNLYSFALISVQSESKCSFFQFSDRFLLIQSKSSESIKAVNDPEKELISLPVYLYHIAFSHYTIGIKLDSWRPMHYINGRPRLFFQASTIPPHMQCCSLPMQDLFNHSLKPALLACVVLEVSDLDFYLALKEVEH